MDEDLQLTRIVNTRRSIRWVVGARAYGGGHGYCPQIDAPPGIPVDLISHVGGGKKLDAFDHAQGDHQSPDPH